MATKKQKQRNFVVLLIIISLVVVASQGLSPFVVSNIFPKSVTLLDTISNNADLDNTFFRIISEVGIGGQEIVGSVTDSQFNQALRNRGSDAWKTDFDLTFKANIAKEQAFYQVQPGSTSTDTVFSYVVERMEGPIFGSTPPCKARSVSGAKVIFEMNKLGTDRFCISAFPQGRLGDLRQPTIKTDVDFEMQRLGKITRGTLTNIGKDSGLKELWDGNELVGRVRITRVSQSAGANPPSINIYRTLFLFGANKWDLKNKQLANDYKTEKRIIESSASQISESSLLSCSGIPGTSGYNNCIELRLVNKIDSVENAFMELLANSEKFSDGSSFFQDISDQNNAQIVYTPSESKLTNVEIALDVQAAWIGVRELVAQPRIQNLQCGGQGDFDGTFTKNGAIKVSVKNDGEVDSVFSAKLNSCNNIRQTFEVQEKPIPKGQIADILIPIDSSGEGFTSTCSVTAFNVGLPDTLKDTKTVSCESKVIAQCDDGDQMPTLIDQVDCVLECSNGEFEIEPAFCCENGLKLDIVGGNTVYACKDSKIVEICDNGIDDDGDGFIDDEDQDCQSGECEPLTLILSVLGSEPVTIPNFPCLIKNFFKDLFSGALAFLVILKWLIVFVGGFVSFFLSKNFLTNLKSFRGKKGAVNVLSFIIALGVAAVLIAFIGGIVFWIITVVLAVLVFLDMFFLKGAVSSRVIRRR